MPTLSSALRAEYQQLFDTCQINANVAAVVDKLATQIMANAARYRGVADPLGVPWYVVGVLHAMEAGLSFACHLHNGDPLTARTVQVPAGRPKAGKPPFTWEASATDALTLEKYPGWTDWSIPGILFKWESFNGWGYRTYHPEVKSPYLWASTNQYKSGKYVQDGLWSPTAVSKQVGAAAILRRLAEKGAMDATSFTTDPQLADAVASNKPALRYNTKTVTPGGIALQHYLNQFPGIFLREDGKLGDLTSAAYKQVFGHYLQGDPRGT
jgi:lysozyme family protein